MSRPSVAQRKLLRLEAIRGLAAVYVVLHHTVPHQFVVGGVNVGTALRFGQEAVIIFFLLSGFVIHRSYRTGADKSFSRYFRSRFLRIYIPLFIVYLISYLVVSFDASQWVSIDAGTLLGNIFMLQDWAFAKPNVIVDSYMDNGPLWSLSYEWWFYMAYFPIVNAGLNKKHRDLLVFSLCALSAVAYITIPLFFIRVAMYFAIWWAGVRLADAYLDGQLNDFRQHIASIAVLLFISLVLFANLFMPVTEGFPLTFGRHPVLELRHFAFALITLIGALALQRFGWRLFDRVTRPFLVFAPISYALYIVHVPLAYNAHYLNFIKNEWVRWTGYIVICLFVAYTIERVIYPPTRAYFSRKLFRTNKVVAN